MLKILLKRDTNKCSDTYLCGGPHPHCAPHPSLCLSLTQGPHTAATQQQHHVAAQAGPYAAAHSLCAAACSPHTTLTQQESCCPHSAACCCSLSPHPTPLTSPNALSHTTATQLSPPPSRSYKLLLCSPSSAACKPHTAPATHMSRPVLQLQMIFLGGGAGSGGPWWG